MNFVASNNYDFIFIVETWLSSKTEDALVCPKGYDIFRKDRINKKGGGVLVLYQWFPTFFGRGFKSAHFYSPQELAVSHYIIVILENVVMF